MLTECCPCVYIMLPTIDPREHTLSVKHCGNYAGMCYVVYIQHSSVLCFASHKWGCSNICGACV